jgi:hypothetical protein
LPTEDRGDQRDNARKDQHEPSEQSCYRLARWIKERFRGLGPIEFFTAILALSTVMQVYAFIESERAFLSIKGGNIEGVRPMGDLPLVLEFQIHNSGRSSAFIDSMNATAQIGTDDLPEYPAYSAGGRSAVRGPVIAGGDYQAKFSPKGTDGKPYIISDAAIEQINIGIMKLYVFGYIRYRDEYSKFGVREVGYCFLFNPRNDATRTVFDDCGYPNYIYAK